MTQDSTRPSVLLVMGSKSDFDHLKPGVDVLRELEISFEVRVASAHRTPAKVSQLAQNAKERGVKVIIAAAGAAAHLAGALASQTLLPVLGIPIASTPLAGFDALLSTAQMPRGIPVGVMSVGGAANASLLAARILALFDQDLNKRMVEWRDKLSERVEKGDQEILDLFGQE